MAFIGRREKQEIIELFGKRISPAKARFFTAVGIDFVPGKREGVWYWDVDGKRLIDCHCNGGVFNLGHRYPEVVETLKAALEELDIGNHHLISEHRASLAKDLQSLCLGT